MSAIDSALETVSVVFLVAALMYCYRLSRLTGKAQIVAIGRPKVFFGAILVSFLFLFLSQFLALLNDIIIPIPYADQVMRVFIIATAFASVLGIYNALYYYRTSSEKVQTTLKQKVQPSGRRSR